MRRRQPLATGAGRVCFRAGCKAPFGSTQHTPTHAHPGERKETRIAQLNINGKVHKVEVEPDTPLLWVLRDHVGLTGTKYGCGVAQCGACSVHFNGEVLRSCSLPVSAVKPTDRIVTIEGLARKASHPVQKAWAELDVPQCGYCQSGQIMAAAALLKKDRKSVV